MIIDLGILALLTVLNIVITSQFSVTWDFPYHYEQAAVRLGEIQPRPDFFPNAYGWFTNMAPYLFTKLFPPSWFPSSYLLFSVVMGSIAVFAFYMFVRDVWGRKTALISSITVFLLPRFVGHIHTNAKDVTTTAFIMLSFYFFSRFLKKTQWGYWVLSLTFFTFAVNTKITALLILPVMGIWTLLEYYHRYWNTKHRVQMLITYCMFLVPFVIIPIIVFLLLWPGSIDLFIFSVRDTTSQLDKGFPQTPGYALIQFVTTTPLPVLAFSIVGLYVLVNQYRKMREIPAIVMVILYIYSLLKYPLLQQPVIDDIRYFLEILFPLALTFVIGVEYICKRFSLYVYIIIFFFCGYLLVIYHPYEIAYNNILATNPDSDFWAASYQEVFNEINSTAPPGTVISAPLAPQLGYMLIRPELRTQFNTKPPEQSDIVVILNRPSFYKLFLVENFFETHTPQKVFRTKNGTPLSYMYYQNNK